MKKFHPSKGFTLIELLVVITIIGILAGIAIPATMNVVMRANQLKSLNNARQIHVGLLAYANDNDGIFPRNNRTGTDIGTGAKSNDAYDVLIPDYVPTEKVFWIAKSAWCNGTAPNESQPASTTTVRLETGENGYAYFRRLSNTSNPNFPVIAEAPKPNDTAYSEDEGEKGGVWRGKGAVVVRVDGSAAVEKLDQTSFKVMGYTGQSTGNPPTKFDILAPATKWLTEGSQVMLYPDPATN